MLCFDNSLLADYLDGSKAAKTFLTDWSDHPWAVPSFAVFEAYMGSLYGRPRGTIEDVFEATRSFEVLPITDETALRAARLQRNLKDDGVELGFVDAVLLAASDEAGATFATSDETLLLEPVRAQVDVVAYEPA